MNRDIYQGAQGIPAAVTAYEAFHNKIKDVRASFAGVGLVVDLHGQAHGQNSTELGYLRSASRLNKGSYSPNYSSIKHLAIRTGESGQSLMAGTDSFGTYLEQLGFKALPSLRQPVPGVYVANKKGLHIKAADWGLEKMKTIHSQVFEFDI